MSTKKIISSINPMEKIKAVWLCHFVNKSIQDKLSLRNELPELSPWISLGIEEIKKREDVELIIISPFDGLRKDTIIKEFNITYYCISYGIPFIHRHWPKNFRLDILTNYHIIRKKVAFIIQSTKPDIIDLHGTENAYYSKAILQKFLAPVIISIQGFISLESNSKPIKGYLKARIETEIDILKRFKYYGIRACFMETYITSFNKDAQFKWYNYPIARNEVPLRNKDIDVVYFARIDRQKGIEDLIFAINIVKHSKPNIKVLVIGSGSKDYLIYIKKLLKELKLEEIIHLKGFISTQQDLHKEVSRGKISVLPTYNDIIPGTIIESMFLGIPVITYNTGGIPDLNIKGENVIILEKGNITGLADMILKMLNDENKRASLAVRARKYALTVFDNKKSITDRIEAYKSIIRSNLSLS